MPPPARPTGRPVPKPAGVPQPKTMVKPGAPSSVILPSVAGGAVAAEVLEQVNSLQGRVSSLQSRVSLSGVREEITSLDQKLNKLAQRLETVRKQGYVYSGDLDPKVYDLIGQWQGVRPQAENSLQQQALFLSQHAVNLHGPLSQLAASTRNAARVNALMPSVSASVDSLANTVSDAERGLRDMYGPIDSEANATESRLSRIEELMRLLGLAKFQLNGGEAGVAAVKAKLDKDGKDDPEGYLYLTDKRLIYEQNQEIATKKVLFITTASEKVQQVLVDTPLSEVSSAKASSKGLLGHEDHLDVEYAGKEVHFHIDGQDSEEWQALIERAKSGGLESERASAGAGVSLADMSGPITQADIVQLQGEVNDLQQRAMLTFAKDALEDLETKVGNLPRQLADVRARGYVFEKALEGQVESLGAQWSGIKQSVEGDVRHQSQLLGGSMQGIQSQMAQVMGLSARPESARPVYLQVKSLVAGAEAQAAAAEQSVLGQYDNFAEEADAVGAHLDWVAWMLEALSTASFQLLATEGGVQAAEANWLRPSTDPLGGILFLTDQRVIFEEREGEFSVPLDVPLSLVAEARPLSGQGAEQDEEHLSLRFDSGAPMGSALFQLVGPAAEDWKAFIGRAKAGDFTNDRAQAIDPAALETVKNAPTQCPSCSSAYTKPVLRGQTEVRCEYCGTVTRL